MFAVIRGTLQVNYFGSFWDDDFTEFVNAIAHQDVAPRISRLIIDGQDDGANGTRDLNFLDLLERQPDFTNLRHLIIAGTEFSHHNRTIIGDSYEEDGQIARLLSLCPNLSRLDVPSAPNNAFFERGEHPLALLKVQAGYDTQKFILNFSQSRCFPYLIVFDYTDYSETYMEDFESNRTPFEDYLKLFESPAFKSVSKVILRNTVCTNEDFKKLRATNPERSITFINTRAGDII